LNADIYLTAAGIWNKHEHVTFLTVPKFFNIFIFMRVAE